ncbi:MAG: hypothetical protein HY816_04250 [Candidatus Wallbacteria bacterium]|nr:hypothetical protein [Candidatus Wallbacteria bacterium]
MRLSRAVVAAIVLSIVASSPVPIGPSAGLPAFARSAVAQDQSALKIMGAASCNTAKCHGSTEPIKDRPGKSATSGTLWAAKDKHAKSFTGLTEKKGLEIAKKMSIDKPETADRCLGCHSLNVPEARRDKKFDIADGNTCEQCHGAGEKWLEPHAEKGWTKAKSIQLGALDTKDIYVRADTCIPCHVGIDHDMIDAGHPYPAFELDTFSATMPPHWEEEDAVTSVKAWAVGQAVALRDSLKWVAKRAAAKAPDKYQQDAWREANGRYLSLRATVKAIAPDAATALEGGMAALKAAVAAKDTAKLAVATDVAAKADAAAKALSKGAVTADTAVTALQALPAEAGEVAGGGLQCAEQLTLSIDTLSKAAGRAGKKFPDAEAKINKLFEDLPEDPSAFKADAYAADLKALEGAFK